MDFIIMFISFFFYKELFFRVVIFIQNVCSSPLQTRNFIKIVLKRSTSSLFSKVFPRMRKKYKKIRVKR